MNTDTNYSKTKGCSFRGISLVTPCYSLTPLRKVNKSHIQVGLNIASSTSTSKVFLVKIRWADISTRVLDFRLHDASRIEKFKTCIYSVT